MAPARIHSAGLAPSGCCPLWVSSYECLVGVGAAGPGEVVVEADCAEGSAATDGTAFETSPTSTAANASTMA